MNPAFLIIAIFIVLAVAVKLVPFFKSGQLQPWVFLIEPSLIFIGILMSVLGVKIRVDNPAFRMLLAIGITWIGVSIGMEFKWDMFLAAGKKRLAFSLIESSVTFIAVLVLLKLLDCDITCAVIAASAASTSHKIAPFVAGGKKELYSPFDWLIGAVVVWGLVFSKNAVHGFLMPLMGIALGLLFDFSYTVVRKRWLSALLTFILAGFLAFLASNLWISPLLVGIFVGITAENMPSRQDTTIELEKTMNILIVPAYFTLLIVAGLIFLQYLSDTMLLLVVFWATRASIKLSFANGDWVLLPQGWFSISIAAEALLRDQVSILPLVAFAVTLNNLLAFLFASLPEME